MCPYNCQLVTDNPWWLFYNVFESLQMHCPLYRLLLLKHKELPMEKLQDIMCHSKDSLISRTTKSDSFNWPSLCHLSPFHLPYVKAGHVACQNVTLTGLLTLRSHFKLSRAMNWVWHLFSKRTNHKLCKKLPNQKRHKDIWNLNTILCTNLQTLYTGGLECLLCRSCFLL